jgi:hypothetical protein
MLDHEDHGMMATFNVVKPGTALPTPPHHKDLAGLSLAEISRTALCREKESL